jgi:uncharacterized protein YndB with AHSA1/START domain
VPELTLTVDVEAPPHQVWRALADWSRQGEWMLLTDVAPVDGDAEGVGGQVRAVTGLRLGGRRLGVVDPFVVTHWDPPHRIDVRHTGTVVRGTGTFVVEPRLAGSRFVWSEQLDLPLGALGRLGWPLVKPLFTFGVKLSLSRFRDFARRHPN